MSTCGIIFAEFFYSFHKTMTNVLFVSITLSKDECVVVSDYAFPYIILVLSLVTLAVYMSASEIQVITVSAVWSFLISQFNFKILIKKFFNLISDWLIIILLHSVYSSTCIKLKQQNDSSKLIVWALTI